MPKIKEKKNNKIKTPSKKQCKPKYVFDIKRIIKEREADVEYWRKCGELDKKLKDIDDLFKSEANKNSLCLQNLGYVIFNCSKYNVFPKQIFNFDTTNLHLQQLFNLSIEENKLEAKILFNRLINVNWIPTLNVSYIP